MSMIFFGQCRKTEQLSESHDQYTRERRKEMNISGILVITTPEHIDEVSKQLKAIAGIDIHFTDDKTGRIVITQEAETISAEVDGLKRIRSLPHIVLAEMSSHYFEEDRELVDAIPAELEDESLQQSTVPAYLND
jgi:nitrate reductase NapD